MKFFITALYFVDTIISIQIHVNEINFRDLGALLHIVKSSMGAGVLAMPYAFKNAGLILGVVASAVTGLAITHAMITLVRRLKLRGRFPKSSKSHHPF